MIRTLEMAQGDLAEYVRAFETCVRDALQDFVTDFAPQRHKLSAITQANIIHDMIVYRVEQHFGTDRDTRAFLHRKGNLKQLVIGGGLYKARLKKVDEKLLTKNIATRAATSFIWQEDQRSFAETPAPTNINVGYQIVNPAALTESKVWVTCPFGNTVAWEWELSAVADERAAAGTAMGQVTAATPPATGRQKRVNVKKPAADVPAAKAGDASAGDE